MSVDPCLFRSHGTLPPHLEMDIVTDQLQLEHWHFDAFVKKSDNEGLGIQKRSRKESVL